MAGTLGSAAFGVAKGLQLHAVKVLGCDTFGTVASVVAGVDWVTANRVTPAVANLSLGGAASTAIDDAVRNSIASGVTYAVASMNANTDACGGPGSPNRLLTTAAPYVPQPGQDTLWRPCLWSC